MPDNKPDDWSNDPALSFGADHPDLPPLPNLDLAPEPPDRPKPFVPPRFTRDILVALRQASEEVKQATLNQHLVRRTRLVDGSVAATVLDERISQIRGALNERTCPSASTVANDFAGLGSAESTTDRRSLRDPSSRPARPGRATGVGRLPLQAPPEHVA